MAHEGCEIKLDYTVQYRDAFDSNVQWNSLPDGPHNSSLVIDPASAGQRFYKLKIDLRDGSSLGCR